MAEEWRCFWIEKTDRVLRALRRFVFSTKEASCPHAPNGGYHHAQVAIEPGQAFYNSAGVLEDPYTHDWPRDDPRWPTHCACGHAFHPDDSYQVSQDIIYVRGDTLEEMTLRTAGAGAMFHSYWHEPHWQGHDGMSVSVIVPPGGIGDIWNIDGPSSKSEGKGGVWTRTGIVPHITVEPSIQTSRWHGWLKGGVLRPC